MRRTIMLTDADSQSAEKTSADANSTQSCRFGEALLSSGQLCPKNGTPHYLKGQKPRLSTMWLRSGSALAGMAVCATACAVLWPHARDAGAILAAQDDPVELSDLELNSALRNDRAAVEQNIEAALA